MKTATLIILAALFAGCAKKSTGDFVQDGIRIVMPIQNVSERAGFKDGGTIEFSVTDAAGKTILFYVDHRIETKTPNAIYLLAYPDDKHSVRVTNEVEFRQKVRF